MHHYVHMRIIKCERCKYLWITVAYKIFAVCTTWLIINWYYSIISLILLDISQFYTYLRILVKSRRTCKFSNDKIYSIFSQYYFINRYNITSKYAINNAKMQLYNIWRACNKFEQLSLCSTLYTGSGKSHVHHFLSPRAFCDVFVKWVLFFFSK